MHNSIYLINVFWKINPSNKNSEIEFVTNADGYRVGLFGLN